MSHRIAAALILWPSLALAQDNPRTVGISVDGTVVEVPVEQAAEACGGDAEALLSQWEALGMELSTMADTSVTANATDLAPEAGADTPMDSVLDGETVADGADAMNEADGDVAQDLASDVNAGEATDATAEGAGGTEAGTDVTAADTEPGSEPGVPADGSMDAGVEATADASATGDNPGTADAATSEEVAAAGTNQDATEAPATPTEGTPVSKAAVCEVSQETADALGIVLPS